MNLTNKYAHFQAVYERLQIGQRIRILRPRVSEEVLTKARIRFNPGDELVLAQACFIPGCHRFIELEGKSCSICKDNNDKCPFRYYAPAILRKKVDGKETIFYLCEYVFCDAKTGIEIR